MTNQELIQKAASIINSKIINDFLVGDVGCALLTDKDNLYLGTCIDTGSSMGFCAEHNAIGSMITAGEYKIKKIVAVWKNEADEIHVITPCGRCREFMNQISEDSQDIDVIMDVNKIVKLSELLPHNDWWKKIEPKKTSF